LRRQFEQLDPVWLLWQIEQLQDALWRHANIATSLVVDSEAAAIRPKMARNGKQLSVVPVCAEEPKPPNRTKRLPIYRYWRTRKDPFEAVWPEIEIQLAKTPNVTGKMLFEWLCQRYPGAFKPGQLRTLQRRVREWRLKLAQEPLESDVKNGHQLP
jgi:hypothetical protein